MALREQHTGVWRSHPFRRYLAAVTLSAVGEGFTLVALPLAILAGGGDAEAVGTVLAAKAAAAVVAMVPAGVVANRVSTRGVMVWANIVRYVGQSAIAGVLLTGTGGTWVLALLSMLCGAASGLYFPVSMSFLPAVLEDRFLHRGNAIVSTAYSTAAVVTPAAAGVLVSQFSPALAIGLDGLCYLASAVLLWTVRTGHGAPNASAAGNRRSWTRETAQAIGLVLRTRWLAAALGHAAVFQVCVLAAVGVAGPVLTTAVHGSWGWASVLSAISFGRLAGGLISTLWEPARPVLAAYLVAVGFAPAMIALARTTSLTALVVLFALYGTVLGVAQTLYTTTLQRFVPLEQLTSVYSVDGLVSYGLQPVGYALIGALVVRASAPSVLYASVFVALVFTLFAAYCGRDVRTSSRASG